MVVFDFNKFGLNFAKNDWNYSSEILGNSYKNSQKFICNFITFFQFFSNIFSITLQNVHDNIFHSSWVHFVLIYSSFLVSLFTLHYKSTLLVLVCLCYLNLHVAGLLWHLWPSDAPAAGWLWHLWRSDAHSAGWLWQADWQGGETASPNSVSVDLELTWHPQLRRCLWCD